MGRGGAYVVLVPTSRVYHAARYKTAQRRLRGQIVDVETTGCGVVVFSPWLRSVETLEAAAKQIGLRRCSNCRWPTKQR